ncbi:hypothetical protein ACP70R_015207 [Stipagrostis hirtigluma subsp. patula]
MATFGHTPLMATTAVKGWQLAGNLPAAAVSAPKPRSAASFMSNGCLFRNHPLQQRVVVVDGRKLRRLKAQPQQEPEQVPPSLSYLDEDEWTLHNYTDLFSTRPRTTYRGVLNTAARLPLNLSTKSEKPKPMSREEQEQHEKDLQQRGRNFMNGLIEYIWSDKEYYKFIILACRENIDALREEGFISSSDRYEILKGLERIEHDIAKGSFEWRENIDMHSYIVEALVDIVGEPAGKFNATMSQDVQMLKILQLWCCDFVDKIISQTKQLQVELILLALRNSGFILQTRLLRRDWILLGDMILSKLELLERDVSRLHGCKKKMTDSMQLVNFPLGSPDGFVHSSSHDDSHLIQNAVINFGNTIIGDIAIDLSTLGWEMSAWMSTKFLIPNDQVTKNAPVLRKHISDLDRLTKVQRRSQMIYNGIQDQDSTQRFLAICVIIQQILEQTTDLSKYTSFNHEKARSFPSDSCTAKITEQDQSYPAKTEEEFVLEKKDGDDKNAAAARQVFIDRSDDTMKKLIDWLVKLQTGEKPLKFCTIDLC